VSLRPPSPGWILVLLAVALWAPAPGARAAGAPDDLPDWRFEGGQVKAWLGYASHEAGDVNGDGFDDVIGGAYRYDGDQNAVGQALVFHGSATGLSITPDWANEDERAGAWYGHSVATAGDINGDGYGDVIVGAPSPSPSSETKLGRVYVYFGSAEGLSTTADWTHDGAQPQAWLGRTVRTAGDVNGDGYDDVIFGEHAWDDGGSKEEGRVFVFHGSPEGLGPTADWTVEGGRAGAMFSRWVATAGDVNADGYDDVIVGAHFWGNDQANEGRAFVYHGSAGGLSTTPNWVAEGDQVGAWFGRHVHTAGDVNADGYDDVIVGAPRYDNDQLDEGRAYVFHGSPDGLSPTPNWVGEASVERAWYGRAVGAAGDIDGDGYDDVIVGAPQYHNGGIIEGGRAFVYLGSSEGVNLTAEWSAGIKQAYAWFGRSAHTAGDVNGDGLADLIIGAPQYDAGEDDEGGVFAFYG